MKPGDTVIWYRPRVTNGKVRGGRDSVVGRVKVHATLLQVWPKKVRLSATNPDGSTTETVSLRDWVEPVRQEASYG
jgi:hypothetical protein